MSQEVELVVEGELVEPGDSFWEEQISEWAEGQGQAILGNLRSARAAGNVERRYGEASLVEFAKEVGRARSTVYAYAKIWEVFGPKLVAGGEWAGESTRLESLTISHLIEACRAPDPIEAAEIAEDEGLSVRQLKARIQGDDTPRNVETIDLTCCPSCGHVYPMSEALVWSEATRSDVPR